MNARQLASASLLAAALVAMAWPAPARAEDASTYRECYKSIRRCQKSRCGSSDGTEQVSCMRQCNREYETCVNGAGGGGGMGSILNIPDKLTTPSSKQRKRDVHRQKTP